MTETKKRKIDDFLSKAGLLKTTQAEEIFVDSIDKDPANDSECRCLNLAWQVSNKRYYSGITESLKKDDFKRLVLDYKCTLGDPVKKELKDHFTIGIAVK
jgi:hypothetical protein